MQAPRPHLVLLPGGRERDVTTGRPLAPGTLRLVDSRRVAELEQALSEAVEAARQMRLEIERRIARALEAFEDRG